jgi:hypothetical protein
MMRITREEEHFIGRARPGFQGRIEGWFAKMAGLQLQIRQYFNRNIPAHMAHRVMPALAGAILSLLYHPLQCVIACGRNVLTNTPRRSPAERSRVACKLSSIMEPIICQAAREN